jgi:hypothetical protein
MLFGLTAWPARWLAERVGGRLLLLVALFGSGVSSLAASEAPSGRALSVCLAMVGACAGLCRPAGASLLSRQARSRNVEQWFGDAALVLAPCATAALCLRVGWQPTYRIVGYGLCALAVACAFFPVDESLPARRPPAPRVPAPSAWRPRLFVLLGLGLAAIAYRGVVLIQPAYFAERVSQTSYGLATSAAYAIGLTASVAARRFAGRAEAPRLSLAWQLSGLALLLLMAALSGGVLVAASALYMATSFARRDVERPLFERFSWPRGMTFGAMQSLAAAAGALGICVVVWAIGFAGLPSAIAALAGVAALGVASAAALLGSADEAAMPAAAPSLLSFPPLDKSGQEGVPP